MIAEFTALDKRKGRTMLAKFIVIIIHKSDKDYKSGVEYEELMEIEIARAISNIEEETGKKFVSFSLIMDMSNKIEDCAHLLAIFR